jgi:hypothetical protein
MATLAAGHTFVEHGRAASVVVVRREVHGQSGLPEAQNLCSQHEGDDRNSGPTTNVKRDWSDYSSVARRLGGGEGESQDVQPSYKKEAGNKSDAWTIWG